MEGGLAVWLLPEEMMNFCYQGSGGSGCQVPALSVHNKGVSLLLLLVWKAPDPTASTAPAAWRGGWTPGLGPLPASPEDFAPLDR